MRILKCDDKINAPISDEWLHTTICEVRGQPLRFGLAEVPDLIFKEKADYNREHVLVRVIAFSLNYRDTALMLGEHPDGMHDRSRGIGSDFVAEIVSVGSEVKGLRVGDRVIPSMDWPPAGPETSNLAGVVTNTASRELQRIHFSRLVRIPDAMSDTIAAAFSVGAQTAYGMLRRSEVSAGTSVLVTAATSMTGLFTASAACAREAQVYCVSRSEQAPEILAPFGVLRTFNAESVPDLQELSKLARRLRGFDVVIDPFCDVYLLTMVKLLGFGGRYVTCRMAGGPNDRFSGTDVAAARWLHMLTGLVAKNAAIHGQCLGERADLEKAVADWEAGRLNVVIDSLHAGDGISTFIDRSFAPGRAGKAVYRFQAADSSKHQGEDHG